MSNQKMKLSETGSLFNWLMANNETTPVPGEYCTILHYTDRTVALVREVKDNFVILEECFTEADGKETGIGHQSWKHTPTGRTYQIKYMRGGWYRVSKVITYTPEFVAEIEDSEYPNGFRYLKENKPEICKAIYGANYQEISPATIVPGYTKLKTSYEKMRILFGKADYYYDWEF